jgi:glycosyltransferase involved in cell wall biosynthesis
MEKELLVSIILPVYNGEKYMADSIESCLCQSYSNIELIIVNDCSTDHSLEIAKSYADKDSRIRIVNNEVNKKLPSSLNVGHREAKGDYITWTSDDNKYKSSAIEKYLMEIQNNKVDIVYSNFDWIDENGAFKSKRVLPPLEYLIWGNVFGASFMYSKKVFQELDGYNEKLFLVEDYDFWIRAILKFKSCKIEESLYLYREHTSSLTGQISSDSVVNELWKNNLKLTMNSFFCDLGLNNIECGLLSDFVVNNYIKPFTGSEYIENHKYFEKVLAGLKQRISKEIAFKFKKTIADKIYDISRRKVTIREAVFLVLNLNFMFSTKRGFYLLKRGLVNSMKF